MVIKINSNKKGKTKEEDEKELFSALKEMLKGRFNVYYKNWYK